MAILKASQIDISKVTDEQIGMCHKVFVGSVAWYKVQSESNPLNEYTVTHSKEKGFTCTCPSGQIAFSNCKDGVCKHVKWALAAAREEREALAELEAAIAEQKKPAPVAPVKPTKPMYDKALYASRERGRLAILEAMAMARFC